MPTKPPPVPRENRSKKGSKAPPEVHRDDPEPKPRENFAEQGRQGNIKQNTTHQGYQQDR